MATHTVKDENDLSEHGDYIRSLSVPTALIFGRNGEIYQRADGKEWPFPALRISLNKLTGGHDRERRGAYGDLK